MVKQQQKVQTIHSATAYEIQTVCAASDVWLRENKGSNATLTFSNQNNTVYPAVIDQDDNVQIFYKNATDASYTQVFGGYAADLTPVGDMNGVVLTGKCVGYDIAFDRMRAATEYGTDSKNPTLNTLLDILTDATEGLIPAWTHKVLNTALSSGYAFNTDNVLDDANELNYVPLPYMPINDSLKTILDLITATSTPNAGLHWTIIPDGTTAYLCIDQIGNHTTAAARWPTYCPVTITPGENVVGSFYGKQQREATYVAYMGKYEYPTNEIITEDAASSWTYQSGSAASSITDSSDCKIGSNSVYFAFGVLGGGTANSIYYFPVDSLNISKIGTARNPPYITAYLKYRTLASLDIIMGTGAPLTNYFTKTITLPTADTWVNTVLSLGSYLKTGDAGEWSVGAGTPDWTDIDYIAINAHWGIGDNRLYLDGLYVNGIVTRGAYNSDYGYQKIKVITDSLAKTSSLVASDDSSTVAQLAKAELLRAQTTPIHGSIVLNQIYPTIKPGQIINDLDLRITEVHFHFESDSHSYTELTVTDDVLNSYPQENTNYGPTAQYNALISAVNPDFQDRDRGNLKARDIDIDQEILAKDYA